MLKERNRYEGEGGKMMNDDDDDDAGDGDDGGAGVERKKQIWGKGRQDAGSAEAILQQKGPEGKAKMEI